MRLQYTVGIQSTMDAQTRTQDPQALLWRPSALLLICLLAVVAISPIAVFGALSQAWGWALDRPEYSHVLVLPFIAAFLVWQQRDLIERRPFSGSWLGVAMAATGVLMLVVGRAGTVLTLQQYGYVVMLGGVALALIGRTLALRLWVPFVIIALMVPLPEFLSRDLSAQLQLVSSQLGVWFLRLFGVSVFLSGNRIDLGSYQLEVAEACSGLRYLFPLMTLGFVMAYFYKTSFWKRAFVFVSAVPVTIVMNSLRIALIGVTVEHWGQVAAEGLLHDFEGWAMFMVSAVVLLLEIMLLSRLGNDRRHWREIFGVELPPPAPGDVPQARWQPNRPFIVAGIVVLATSVTSLLLPEQTDRVPARRAFAEYPLQLGAWEGQRQAMQSDYLDQLKLSDYILGDFQRAGSNPVNLYVSWYDTQSAGRAVHSPSACLPGGGWRITSLRRQEVRDIRIGAQPLAVNRALIQYGDQRQLVWYWFQQRGRVITNEYLVKWYLFWDSVTRHRTDGAMVRVMVPLTTGQDEQQVERQLHELVSMAAATLPDYVPG